MKAFNCVLVVVSSFHFWSLTARAQCSGQHDRRHNVLGTCAHPKAGTMSLNGHRILEKQLLLAGQSPLMWGSEDGHPECIGTDVVWDTPVAIISAIFEILV